MLFRSYQQNKTAKSKAEIQQMILDVLRSIRFENETGYYFAIRMDGMVMLNTNKPELEGKNLLGLKDTHGKSFIKEMIKIASQSDEGFDEYYWVKPGVVRLKDFDKRDLFKIITFNARLYPVVFIKALTGLSPNFNHFFDKTFTMCILQTQQIFSF